MLTAGSRLGPYEIVAPAGQGGMGEVYRARDTRLDRTVAIKLLADASAPHLRDRLQAEARAISALEHPNICALYDVGDNYLVMQYVDGPTLAGRLASEHLPIDDALAVALQIASGLEAAHERGIVHRDLKPSNIKFDADGRAKILDFGLAKALAPAFADVSASPTHLAATEAGTILGTAAYMSPEQARGKPVDKRADIWAFGCVVFEMLAGRRAFDGDTATDVLASVVRSEPDWQLLRDETPQRVRVLLRRCLQKDAARRLRDIGDARLELEDAIAEVDDIAPASAPRGQSAALAWTVAALSLAAAFATFLILRPRADTRPPMRFSAVTNLAGVEAQPTLSPDGRSVAFVSNRDGQWDVYVGLVTGGSLIRVTNDPNLEARPRWSPDGLRLAYARLNDDGLFDVWTVPALGGTPRRIVRGAREAAWSPVGGSLAYTARGAIWMSDAAGGNPRQVTYPDLPRRDTQPAFSHDGRLLAYARRTDGPYGEIFVTDLEGGRTVQRTSDHVLAMSPAWSPDDRFIYFASTRGGTMNIWKMPARSGESEQITVGQGDDAEFDLSLDGRRLVYSSYRQNVNLAEMSIDPPDSRLKWLTTDAARGESAPRYSPDGRRIAYFSNRAGAERESIWVMDADGSNATRLVEDEYVNTFPRWTADGQAVLFHSVKPEDRDASRWTRLLRRVALNGGAPEIVSSGRPSGAPWGDVGRDDRILSRLDADAAEILDPRTGQRTQIRGVGAAPVWSPDGQRVASLIYPETGAPADAGAWITSLGGERRQLFKGWVVACNWMGADDLLVLEGKPDLTSVLWRIDMAGARTRIASGVSMRYPYTTTGGFLQRFDVHPDRRRIVLEVNEFLEADISMIENVR